jgi:hypothetical protein
MLDVVKESQKLFNSLMPPISEEDEGRVQEEGQRTRRKGLVLFLQSLISTFFISSL